MDLAAGQRVCQPVSGSLTETYPHDLQMYTVIPTANIALEEFEMLAWDRLKVLQVVDQVRTEHRKKSLEERKEIVIGELKLKKYDWFAKLMTASGCGQTLAQLHLRRRDHISHFAVQLAYSRDADRRLWFCSVETEIFCMRYLSLSPEGVLNFLHVNSIVFTPIAREEKERLKESLYACMQDMTVAAVDTAEFYKVPFQQVLSLVARRRVYLEGGWAYFPNTEIFTAILYRFKSNLSNLLILASRALPEVEKDRRLIRLLKELPANFVKREYVGSEKQLVKNAQLDELSKTSFPPCMQLSHSVLRSKHHLQYGGRLQYGLFLKGIGLSLEDSLHFWREEFTKIMDLSKFETQYSYNVRHSYGQEGNRVNYKPHYCAKILKGVGSGDGHGCPFKHANPAALERLLRNTIPAAGVSEVAELASQGYHQDACSRFFELVHHLKTGGGPSIKHPNQYFDSSQKLKAEAIQEHPGNPMPQDVSLDPVLELLRDLTLEDFNMSSTCYQ